MEVILTFLMFLPLLAVLWLASSSQRAVEAGDRERAQSLRRAAYGLLAVLYVGLLGLALLLLGFGWLAQNAVANGLVQDEDALLLLERFAPGKTALALAGPSLLGLVLLLPPIRRAVARFTALRPENPVHTVALSMTALVVLNLTVILAVGIGVLAESVEGSAALRNDYDLVLSLWVQNACLLLAALLGVGWLARRGLRAALQRLGVVALTFRQALLGLGCGVLLVPLVLLLEGAAAAVGWGIDPDVERLTEQLIGPLTNSALGIVTLGLGAALGEETVFRGAMQPRFGLALTALVFALLHGQYGLSLATLLVFLIGLLFGLLRQRANTTAAMLAHATYNISLGLISYLGWLQGV